MRRAALIAAGLGLLAGPGLACSPAPFQTPVGAVVEGPGCGMEMALGAFDAVRLGAAERLRGGLSMQALSEGNGCYARLSLVVHDCTAGRVAVIGPETFDLMASLGQDPAAMTGLESIHNRALDALKSGSVQTLDDFTALSRAQGLGEPQMLGTTESLHFGGQSVPLSCACATARDGG